MRSKKEIQLLQALEAAACSEGFDLVDLEFAGSGKSTVLRIYIDKAEGLTLDEIALANAWISQVVEDLDPCKGSYMLEVSSPGIDRPLRTWEHFVRALGEEVVITLESSFVSRSDLEGEEHPRLKYTGIITHVDSDKLLITLEAEGVLHTLDFTQIKKARTKGRLDFEGRRDS